MESLIFAAVIGLTVYLFIRRMSQLKAQKRRKAEVAASGGAEPAPQASMPRVGSPGTITRDQIKQLKANDFEPSRLWSREEAQLILDTVVYMRAAIFMTTKDSDPPLDVQNSVLRFILGDDELRAYIYDWGPNRTREESEKARPNLERDAAFGRVEAEILRLWQAT